MNTDIDSWAVVRETTAHCAPNRREVSAEVVIYRSKVWLHKHCKCCKDEVVEVDPLFYMAAIRASERYVRSKEPQLQLDITSQCNKECPACYFKETGMDVGEPTIDALLNAAFGFKRVILSGGEPTLRDDLPDLLRAFKSQGKAVAIYTNGIKLAENPGLLAKIAPFLVLPDGSLNIIHTVQGVHRRFCTQLIRAVFCVAQTVEEARSYYFNADIRASCKTLHIRAKCNGKTCLYLSDFHKKLTFSETHAIDYMTFTPYYMGIKNWFAGKLDHYTVIKFWPTLANADLDLLRAHDVCQYSTGMRHGNAIEMVLRSYADCG